MKTATRPTQKARARARATEEPPVTAEEVSTVEAGRRLGLSNQAIGQWCARPGAPMRKDGGRVYVRWPDFPRWREQQMVDAAKPNALTERRLVAEARAAEISTQRAELALARELAESVAIADYGQALGTILDRLTARLRGLPPRFARFGAEVEAAADAEVERVVTELHAWDEDVVDEGPPDEASAAAESTENAA